MANHPSSEKRNRQRIQRTTRNRAVRTGFRTLVKAVREAVKQGDAAAAKKALGVATEALDGAVSKGVLHRRTASRHVSRLAKSVHAATVSKK